MFVFQASFITGMMVGIEFDSRPAKQDRPAYHSVVLDLLIVRLIFQTHKV